MLTVTVDTNTLPLEQLSSRVPENTFEFAVTTVSEREIEGSDDLIPSSDTPRILETAVLGDSRFGEAVFGGKDAADCLEEALMIIGDGSFPARGKRSVLTVGQTRQLRDAMVLCAHVREGRAILLTNDARAFIKHCRREKLEKRFGTTILTTEEFIARYAVK